MLVCVGDRDVLRSISSKSVLSEEKSMVDILNKADFGTHTELVTEGVKYLAVLVLLERTATAFAFRFLLSNSEEHPLVLASNLKSNEHRLHEAAEVASVLPASQAFFGGFETKIAEDCPA